MRLHALAALAAGALLAGCGGGVRPYPDQPVNNLTLRTDARSGSAFSRLRVSVSVHGVDLRCRTTYEGTVNLDQPVKEIGLPAERWSLLVFHFEGSGFLGGSQTSIAKQGMLRPRAAYRYEAAVSYVKDLYDVELRERAPGGRTRELELLPLSACPA